MKRLEMTNIVYVLPFVILALFGCSQEQTRGTEIQVPSDMRARYWMVEGQRVTATILQIITRRDGPSGRSFAFRQIDCDKREFRYLGEGDTLEEAKVGKNFVATGMESLVPQSISTYIADFACANIK